MQSFDVESSLGDSKDDLFSVWEDLVDMIFDSLDFFSLQKEFFKIPFTLKSYFYSYKRSSCIFKFKNMVKFRHLNCTSVDIDVM